MHFVKEKKGIEATNRVTCSKTASRKRKTPVSKNSKNFVQKFTIW